MSGRDERPKGHLVYDRILLDAERTYAFMEDVDAPMGSSSSSFLRGVAMLAGVKRTVQHFEMVVERLRRMMSNRERELNVGD